MKSICGLVFVILMTITVTLANIQGRIHAGSPVTEVIPYNARLSFSNTQRPETGYTGSGVLISRIHVLTTAINIRGFNQWSAGFGALNIDDLIYFEATGAIVHENYAEETGLNNIGIIFFGAGIYSAEVNIQPIALPLLNEQVPVDGETGIFAAFGLTTPTGGFTDILLQGQQQVFSKETCSNLVSEGEFSNQFCAVDLVNFTTPCGGEQGAGFVQQIRNQPVVVGLITSVAGNCNLVTAVTFYTRVADFRFWVMITIGV